jgi:hypothetical protein
MSILAAVLPQISQMKQYRDWLKSVEDLKLTPSDVLQIYSEFAKKDLYFLLRYILNVDCENDWLFDRIREVQRQPNGYLDLWAREHYKSTIITYALSIFEIINNPEITIGLFSHTRGLAKDLLKRIKTELEQNSLLQDMYPDIFFKTPENQSLEWTNEAILVNRKSNRNEKTVEAWGVVDNQPIGKHFDILLYDDVVVPESVTTQEQIDKTTERLKLSFNLGNKNGVMRFIGTRYHPKDTYKNLIDNNIAKPRIYTATQDGTADGKPVLLTQENLDKKKIVLGSYIFGCQMLQNPSDRFKVSFAGQMFSYELIEASKRRQIPFEINPGRCLGVDPKREGEDSFGVFYREGKYGRCVFNSNKAIDTAEAVDLIIAFIERYAPEDICIDSGKGEALIDGLRGLNYKNIHEIKFDARSHREDAYNKRSAMYADLLDWIIAGGKIEDNKELEEELLAQKYDRHEGNLIKLIPKVEIKKMLGRSPGLSDAAALTFAVKRNVVARRYVNAISKNGFKNKLLAV